MLQRSITVFTLIIFILYLYGCSSIEVVQLNADNFDEIKDSEIVSAATKDYYLYEFDLTGIKPKPQIMDSLLVGCAISERERESYKLKEVKIPISEIRSMEIEETAIIMGGLITIGSLALIIGFPFVLMVFGKGFSL